MNIFIISHGFQVHYTVGFINGLAANGLKPHLVRSKNLSPDELSPEVTSVDYGQNLGGEKPGLAKLMNFLKYHLCLMASTLCSRGQIIHVIGVLQRKEWVSGIAEGLWFRLVGKRYLLTVHNLLPHNSHTRYKKFLYYLIYRIPHLLVVHTPKMAEDLVKDYGIHRRKILIVEHGINDSVPESGIQKGEARGELGFESLPEGGVVLLFFGIIQVYKGLEDLLTAFGELDDRFYLVIAGKPKPSEYGKTIQSAIDSCVNKSRIRYNSGWINDDDIERFFKAADFLVLPYKHIDQSGVLFLGFRYGLPIIASDVGSMGQYIKTFAGGTVEPSQPMVLASKIRELAEKRGQYSREQIKEYGQASFEWKNTIAPLVSYYRDCENK